MLESSIQKFLLSYRTAPHSTTNFSPSELLYKRQIRNVLDLVKPSVYETLNFKTAKCNDVSRYFIVGDNVMVKRHSGNVKWVEGVIVEVLGSLRERE